MGKDSAIQWCHHTLNCWRGCTKVSPGCKFCYAETLSKRNPATLGVWGPNGTRVVASDEMWRKPLQWDQAAAKAGERHRVFCMSLADVFEAWDGRMIRSNGYPIYILDDGSWWRSLGGGVPAAPCRLATMDDVRRRLAKLVWETPNLDYLFLTKRAENAREMLYRMWFPLAEWPANYWLGVTVEDRAALARLDVLRDTPAPVRFLSIEPLIEDLGRIDLRGIDWVIVGGESGPKARPFDLGWARSIRDQCREAGVPFFMKQLGAKPFDFARRISIDGPASHAAAIDLEDSHGGDPDEWPEDLRVREFPEARKEAALGR